MNEDQALAALVRNGLCFSAVVSQGKLACGVREIGERKWGGGGCKYREIIHCVFVYLRLPRNGLKEKARRG